MVRAKAADTITRCKNVRPASQHGLQQSLPMQRPHILSLCLNFIRESRDATQPAKPSDISSMDGR